MKIVLFSFLFIIYSPIASSKFLPWVFQIPCDKLTLKVKSCKPYSFSNGLKKGKIEREGSLVEAGIEKLEPIKCSKNQKMDLKRFKKRDFKLSSFFVRNYKCGKNTKTLTVKRVNFFCDTPGAKSVVDCFVPAHSREQKFIYTEHLK